VLSDALFKDDNGYNSTTYYAICYDDDDERAFYRSHAETVTQSL